MRPNPAALTLTLALIALACVTPTETEPLYPGLPEVDGTIVDTGQDTCYGLAEVIPCPAAGQGLYGQDAQHTERPLSYRDNGDGTVTDLNTGLIWTASADLNGDGAIDYADKLTADEAEAAAASIDVGGYGDWRLPTIKELYSLIDFRGLDPSGEMAGDLTPFIDTDYFAFGYGDESAGERIIDAQFATSTRYVGTTINGAATMFGVNFADGRIKGYPTDPSPVHPDGKRFYVLYVRGESGYGENVFVDHGDGTVTDQSTGLTWSREDSGVGMDWEAALAWVQARNDEAYLGYTDWRLPNVKELQSLVDYTRAPAVTGTAALDPVFQVTAIVNEAGQTDYPAFWSSTTHANGGPVPGANAAYVAFGRAMGYMDGRWQDVHGAGAQRSDPKTGSPDDWPYGHGPQGDAIRIYNFVRLVRGE